MCKIKRINLSFDLSRGKDKRVFDILKNKSAKTNFVIESILAYISNNHIEKISKETIKDAIKEALQDMHYVQVKEDQKENIEENQKEEHIPDKILNIFDNM